MKIFSNQGFGLLLLRLTVGGIFLYHGITKFQNLEGTIGFFGKLGLAPFWAYLVATVETVGGALMVLGLWTTIVGLLFAVILIVALVKTKIGTVTSFSGAELDVVLLLASLSVAFAGAGSCSLIRCFKKCEHKDAAVKAAPVASAPAANPPSTNA